MNERSKGKLTIKDCQTEKQENDFLKRKANKSKSKNDEFENTHEFKLVRKDHRTVFKVRMEKYLKNKEYYDNLCVL